MPCSEWQTGSAPKDGSVLLGVFGEELYLVRWEKGHQPDGWATVAQIEGGIVLSEEPRLWMKINIPEGVSLKVPGYIYGG